jgi:hypothetical protein
VPFCFVFFGFFGFFLGFGRCWCVEHTSAGKSHAPESSALSSDGDDGLAMMMQPLFGSLEWSGGADGAIQGIVL